MHLVTQAANALEKERVVAAEIHKLRALVDARQALPTNGESVSLERVRGR